MGLGFREISQNGGPLGTLGICRNYEGIKGFLIKDYIGTLG